MSIIYTATISPTKNEIIESWLPKQSWFNGDVSKLKVVGGYRVDDPAGEVGMQGQLVTAGDNTVYHVAMSYRGAPLEGAEEFLMSTMDHSVLGDRWIYDAIADPVYQAVLADKIARGGVEAEEFRVQEDGSHKPWPSEGHLRGSGSPDADVPDMQNATVATEDAVSSATSKNAVLSILRLIDENATFKNEAQTLNATWKTQETPVVLATLATRDQSL